MKMKPVMNKLTLHPFSVPFKLIK